jgi:large subunit ribosomal protein L24
MGHIRKGDTVAVLSGKDRGKTGKVLQVWPAQGRALVERINMLKHFDRRTQQNQAGGIVERESSLAISKLALFCPKCKKPSRAGWSQEKDRAKQRICHRCDEPFTAS